METKYCDEIKLSRQQIKEILEQHFRSRNTPKESIKKDDGLQKKTIIEIPTNQLQSNSFVSQSYYRCIIF